MQCKAIFKSIILTMFSLVVFAAQTSELEIPNTFVDGEVTSASEMNANFEAIKAAINDNHALITNGGNSFRVQVVGWTPTAVNVQGGLFAAKKMCSDFVPNSHICSPDDIYNSVISSDVLTAIENSEFPAAYILYNPGGLQNCRDFNLSAEEVEQGYTGSSLIGKGGNRFDSHWETGSNHYCGTSPTPLACCR